MFQRIVTKWLIALLWAGMLLVSRHEPARASTIYTSAASTVHKAEVIVSGRIASIEAKKHFTEEPDPFDRADGPRLLRKHYYDDATLEVSEVLKGNPMMSVTIGADGDTVRTVHLQIDAGTQQGNGLWSMSSEARRTAAGEEGIWFLSKGTFDGTYWWSSTRGDQEADIRKCLKTLDSDYAGWEPGFATDEQTIAVTGDLNGFSGIDAIPQSDGSTMLFGRYKDELVLAGKRWFSSPTYDYFIARLNSSGKVDWCKQVGCGQSAWVSLSRGVGNSVLMVGGMRESCSFLGQRVECTPPGGQIIIAVSTEGSVLWTRSIPNGFENLWLQPHQGEYRMGGSIRGEVAIEGQTLRPVDGLDWFLGTLDGNGKVKKVRVVGLPGDQQSNLVQMRHDGSVLLGGGTKRSQDGRNYDAMLCVLSPTGAVVWADTIGGRWMDGVWAMAVGPHDEVVASITIPEDAVLPFVYGSTQETKLTEGKRKLKLYAWSPPGKRLWNVAGGGAAMAIDDSGMIYCAGSYGMYGAPELPENMLPKSRGDQDIYLACYDHSGALQWASRDGGLAYDSVDSLELLPNHRALLIGTSDAKSFIAGHVVKAEGWNGSFVVALPLKAPTYAH